MPRPAPGQVLVKVLLSGICNTDLELQRGYYNFQGIPGHEFVGRVVECGDDAALLGQRVVGEINLACGKCVFCLRGLSRHCSSRTVLGIVNHPGAFAEYLTLPVQNLHIVPEDITDREAVFVEPLAAACEILDQLPSVESQQVAVLGDGKLGLLVAQVLRASGASVLLFGRHAEKLQFAVEQGIATANGYDNLHQKFPVVVDCTGSAAGLKRAVDMTLPRGTVVMKSTVQEAVSIDMAPVIVNEISLVGSRCGRFEPAMELLSNRQVKVDRMVQGEYPLEQAAEAFEKAAQKGTLKILLRPGTTAV